MSFNLLILASLGYVVLLFIVAFVAEDRAARGHSGWARSPWVYTLSLSVYCTAWTQGILGPRYTSLIVR